MKNQTIEGIGSIVDSEYDTLTIEGIGKLKRKATIKTLDVEGLFKSKARFDVDEMKIEGVARVFKDIKAKTANIDGILKLRRAKLNAQKIKCDGIIVCNKEVSADEIYIDGVCSVSNMYGDNLTIQNKINGLQESKLPSKLRPFFKLYFGRKISASHSLVDIIECTSLKASGLKADIVRAGSVKLSNNCIIKKLYCEGEMLIDESCKILEIIGKNSPKYKEENDNMANASLTKILDLYKNGTINADEAEKMITSLTELKPQSEPLKIGEQSNLLWDDDGKLRIVAFIGRKLLKKGEDQARDIEVRYDGEALNVESYGNLNCKDIGGNATAGGNMTVHDINGNITCGGNLSCNEIDGNITAGGGIHIQK